MKRYLLYFRPVRSPKWWPRTSLKVATYVGVLRDGDGWCVGDGDVLTQVQVSEAKRGIVLTFGKVWFKKVLVKK